MQHLKELSSEELYQKALICKEKKNYRYMKKILGQAIEKGHVPSMALLARMYYFGRGVKKNQSRAVYIYEQAIRQGSVDAILFVGKINASKGKFKEAEKLFKVAISKGCNEAINELVKVYIHTDLKYVTKVFMIKKESDKTLIKYVDDDSLIKDGFTKSTYRDTVDVENYFFNLGYPHIYNLREICGWKTDFIHCKYEVYKLKKQIEILSKENQEMKIHIEASPEGPLFFELQKTWLEERSDQTVKLREKSKETKEIPSDYKYNEESISYEIQRLCTEPLNRTNFYSRHNIFPICNFVFDE